MTPFESFQHCPRCGSDSLHKSEGKRIDCRDCQHQYFINSPSGSVALIRDDQGRVLLIRRAKEPAKGKLALPGGIIDAGETAEGALVREIKEELNLNITGSLEYLCSQLNNYHYSAITYPILDLFFIAQIEDFSTLRLDTSEVSEVLFLHPEEIHEEEIAFKSSSHAIDTYRQANS